MDAIEIGKIIKYHRKLSGLSRLECARLAGIGKTSIFDIEHGKETVQLRTLLQLLNVLNIQLELSSPVVKYHKHEKG